MPIKDTEMVLRQFHRLIQNLTEFELSNRVTHRHAFRESIQRLHDIEPTN